MWIFAPEKLTRAREAARVSRGELADQLGVARSTVWRWEKGAAVPDVRQLAVVATALRVRPSELFTGTGPAGKPPATP